MTREEYRALKERYPEVVEAARSCPDPVPDLSDEQVDFLRRLGLGRPRPRQS